MIVQGSCASLAEYSEHMERLRPYIAEFVTRIETSFISKETGSALDDRQSHSLWLPCEGGHKQVQMHMIDKVEADGDYMRVHVGDWKSLIHETFYRLSGRLGRADFIKLHRSSLVRIGFIDRVIHRNHRWTALLRDGSQISVAKSQVQKVLQLMTGESLKRGGYSSQHAAVTDASRKAIEKQAAAAR